MVSRKYDIIYVENKYKNVCYLDYDNRQLYIKKAKDLLKRKLYNKFIQDGNTLCLYPYRKIVSENEYLIPCGKCFYCRTRRSSEWQQRINNEITAFDGQLKYGTILFITLTYNDDNLSKRLDVKDIDKMFENVYFDSEKLKIDIYNDLVQRRFKKDFKNFIDKLRRFFKSRNYNKFKYFCSFEYGDLNGREHFHLILFLKEKFIGEDFELLKKKVEKYWNFGFVNFRNVYDYRGLSRYVSKYIMKGSIKQDFGLLQKGKLFSLKSRRIGWDGYMYLLTNKMYDKVNTIPRSLYLKIKENNPDLYTDFRAYVSVRNKRRLLEKAIVNLDIDLSNDFDSSMIDIAFNRYVKLFDDELRNKRRIYFVRKYTRYEI